MKILSSSQPIQPIVFLAAMLIVGCALSACSIYQTQGDIPLQSSQDLPTIPDALTPTIRETSTHNHLSGTPTSSQPTINVVLPQFFPEDAESRIWAVKWIDERNLALAYTPFPPFGPEAEMTLAALPPSDDPSLPLGWLQYDIVNAIVSPISSPLTFDTTFWARYDIPTIFSYPELYGYFSPSGEKVIYNIWHGSILYDPDSTTEIFVQGTQSGDRTKVYQFGYSNVYILRAEWNPSEDTVYFAATYEGPSQLYVVDLSTGHTSLISEITDWDGVTEDTFHLSPDGTHIAAIDSHSNLILVSLEDGSIAIVAQSFSSVPIWSPSGDYLYYWHGPEWMELDQFRRLDTNSLESLVLLESNDLASAVRSLGIDIDPVDEQYLMGGIFAVSPSGESLFFPETIVGPIIINISTVPGA